MKPLFLKIVLVLAAIIYCLFEASGDGDFYIFVSAGGKLDGVTDIYTIGFKTDYHYYYSVLFALVLKPFYYLPFFWVKFVWLMLNLFLYYRLFMLLFKSKMVSLLENKSAKLFMAGVFIFSFRFLHENIHLSQITILILYCSVYGIYWITEGKQIKGSLILALGINIKLLPIVLLPYLLYRGYFKAFIITLSAYVLSLFAPSLFVTHSYNMDLLKSWFNLINPTNTHHVLDVDERSFHSLTTLLTTLFIENPPDPLALPYKRNIADVSVETLSYIILFTRLVLVAFTLYFLRITPFAKAKTTLQQLTELSYILLLVPLIFPHQQHYAFLFTTPAFAVCLYTFITQLNTMPRYKFILTGTVLSIIYLLSNLKILFGEYNRIYEHYKLLTYGAVLLIPLLVWSYNQNNHFKLSSETDI